MSTFPFISLQRATDAAIRFDPHAPAAPARTPRTGYSLREHAGADRALVERFIASRFTASFGARIGTFMPCLFGLHDRDGALRGAFGLRCASRPLFVEQYLDAPIETAIARRAGIAPARAAIIEVGHLCGAFPGAMRTIIRLLTLRLHGDGFEWVAFAGTRSLHNAFVRVGMHPLDLGAARIEHLPADARAGWGSYYAHKPRVLAGRIAVGVDAIASGRTP